MTAPEHLTAGLDIDIDLERSLGLHLMGDGATVEEMVARVQQLAERFDQRAADRVFRDLADAGLVRIAMRQGNHPSYVRTTLGSELAASELSPDSATAERLVELERLRTDFVATMAHELKTPLTAIRTCIGLLTDPDVRPDPDVLHRLYTRIAVSADAMQELIASLLDLARYRAGSVTLEPRWLDALDLAREASAAVRTSGVEPTHPIRFTVPQGPLAVFVDRRRMLQALANILSNAQKFSDPGSEIEVAIRTAPGELSWSIEDHGVGISESDRGHLFERFFRGRSDEGGSGLGLPIALAAVQAHGGTITVDSEPGRGSTFTVTVPVPRLPAEDA